MIGPTQSPAAPTPPWWRAIPFVVLGAIIVAWTITTFPFIRGGLQAEFDARGELSRAGDYPHYYFAAKAALDGTNIYESYRGGYLYPPLLAAALSALVPLGMNISAIIWWVVIAGLFAWLWILSLKEQARRWSLPLDPRVLATASAIAALVFMDPIRAFLRLAQADSIVMLGFALPLAWLGATRGRDRTILAALGVAVSFHVKFLAIGLLPYFAAARKWAVLAWSVAALVLVGLAPAFVLGWHRNLEFLHVSLARLGHVVGLPAPSFQLFDMHPLAWDRSRSILSGLARVADHLSLPHSYAYAGAALVTAAWIAMAALIYRRHGLSFAGRLLRPASIPRPLMSRVLALEVCSVIAAILALGPQTAKRHAIVLIPAMLLAGLIVVAGRVPAARRKCLFGLAALFLTSFLPAATVLSITDPWRSLGTLGGMGWAIAAFAVLLLDAGLQESAAISGPSPRVPSPDA